MTPCPSRVFGIRPCTRPIDHPPPHVGDFTPQEEPMTVRPRYTPRAKARDLTIFYGLAAGAILPTLLAIARQIIPAMLEQTRHVARAGYVDPPDRPIDPHLVRWLDLAGVDERDQRTVAAAIDNLVVSTGMPLDDALELVCMTVAGGRLDMAHAALLRDYGYPIAARLAEVRGEYPHQAIDAVRAGQVTAWNLINALEEPVR